MTFFRPVNALPRRPDDAVSPMGVETHTHCSRPDCHAARASDSLFCGVHKSIGYFGPAQLSQPYHGPSLRTNSSAPPTPSGQCQPIPFTQALQLASAQSSGVGSRYSSHAQDIAPPVPGGLARRNSSDALLVMPKPPPSQGPGNTRPELAWPATGQTTSGSYIPTSLPDVARASPSSSLALSSNKASHASRPVDSGHTVGAETEFSKRSMASTPTVPKATQLSGQASPAVSSLLPKGHAPINSTGSTDMVGRPGGAKIGTPGGHFLSSTWGAGMADKGNNGMTNSGVSGVPANKNNDTTAVVVVGPRAAPRNALGMLNTTNVDAAPPTRSLTGPPQTDSATWGGGAWALNASYRGPQSTTSSSVASHSPAAFTSKAVATTAPSETLAGVKELPSAPTAVLFKKKPALHVLAAPPTLSVDTASKSPFKSPFKSPSDALLKAPTRSQSDTLVTAGPRLGANVGTPASEKGISPPPKAVFFKRKPSLGVRGSTSVSPVVTPAASSLSGVPATEYPRPTTAVTEKSATASPSTLILPPPSRKAATTLSKPTATTKPAPPADAATASTALTHGRRSVHPWNRLNDAPSSVSTFKTGHKRRREEDVGGNDALETRSRRQKTLPAAPLPAATTGATAKRSGAKSVAAPAGKPRATMTVLDESGVLEEVELEIMSLPEIEPADATRKDGRLVVKSITKSTAKAATRPAAKPTKSGKSSKMAADAVLDDVPDHFSFLHPRRSSALKLSGRPTGPNHPPRTRAEMDTIIYSQPEAHRPPPPGVYTAKMPAKITEPPFPFVFRNPDAFTDGQLYLPMDPRVHYNSARPAGWNDAKLAEIRARKETEPASSTTTKNQKKPSTRKNKEQEEQQPAEKQQLDKKAKTKVPSGDPSPWTYARPVDFGDVPEDELPDYVRANPQWMRACAWMRECRQKRLKRAREVEIRRERGLDMGHLVRPREKQSTYRPDEPGVWRAERV